MRSSLTRLSLWGLAATVLVACTTSTDVEPVATISLSPQFDSVEIGQSFGAWSVTLKDLAGNTLAGRTRHWESSNTTVATIDASTGVLTALSSGMTVVTLRVEGQSATANFKVLLPVVSIAVTPDSFDLPLTTTRTINAQLVGPGGVAITNRTITWASQNPSIAVVNGSGMVTPVSTGTTTILLGAGQLERSVRVRVIAEPVQSVRILPQQSVHVIRLGQTKQLTAECLNASQQVLQGRTITWNSANPIVATVSGTGLVSSLQLGTANITATCDGSVNATVSVQVTPVPVASVSITPNGMSLPDNTQGQLTAVARDSANNVLSLQGRQVVWNSSNLPVATVSNQGVVSASNPGTTEITVSVDGVSSAPVIVTVTLFSLAGGQQLEVGAALENRPAVAADHLAANLRQLFRPADIARR